MELKFEKNDKNRYKPFGFNCTFMELKLRNLFKWLIDGAF